MIPLQLTIKGMHSYRDESHIDFSRLTEAGLFGVFGPTGSGKSTILEAISLALYGDNDRMGSRGRGYNQLNLQSDELKVDYEFLLEQTGQRYRFEYQYSRNKKDFTKVSSPVRNAYQWNGAGWSPIDADGGKIIGQSYTNFKRTMIIPQGKFQEFLSLGGSERTAMMEQLFDLQKYNLADKTSFLLDQTKEEHRQIEAQLMLLQDISEETIASKEVEGNALQIHIQQQERVLQALDVLIEPLVAIRNDTANLHKLNRDKKDIQAKLSNLEEKKADLSAKSTEPWANEANIAMLEREILDLEAVLEWIGLSKMLETEQVKLQKFEQGLLELEQARAVEEEKVETFKTRIQEIKSRLPDIGTLKDVESRLVQLNKQKASLHKAAEDLQNSRAALSDLYRQTCSSAGVPFADTAESEVMVGYLQTLQVQFEAQIQGWENEHSGLYDTKQKLALDLKLNAWATSLEEGQKCPLCGSLHHPDKFSAEAKAEHQKEVDNAMELLKNQINRHRSTRDSILAASSNAQNLIKEAQKLENQIGDLHAEVEGLQAAHHASEFHSLDFAQVKDLLEAASQLQQEIKALEKEQLKAEKDWKHTQGRCEKGKNETADQRSKVANLQGRVQTQQNRIVNQSLIQHPPTDTELGQQLETKQSLLHTWQERLKEWKVETENTNRHLSNLQGQWQQCEGQINDLNQKLEQSRQRLALLWQEKQKDLGTLAIHPYPFSQEEKENEAILDQWTKLRKEVQEAFSDAKSKLEYLLKDLSDLKTKLADKQQRLQEMDKLDTRIQQLNTLAKLFKARGFVEFMSHRHLLELCRLANMRFQKLNRNQLVLEIDEKFEFIVRDIVNGGKTRNVSTLSGGQLFQASLCLALALSEQIRKSDYQQFFFLDEGFGSQDENSLDLIMQTLKDLKKENRIVGLISHVEKMKEDIGVYLNITHNGSDGSRVKGSWDL
ncbi:MAG: SMC family ATPase [Saprospiraceae bacterium]|nr:SMC family ATPase [Saprospiraceae bacterium]